MEIDNWNKQQVSALIVIAHPDDETIFMGGTILRHPDWKWKIVSVTYDKNSFRGKELQSAVEKYKNLGVSDITLTSLGMQDSYDVVTVDKQKDELKNKLNPVLSREYDMVFTHNSEGIADTLNTL